MYTYAWYHWLTFFYIYCFFGWIFESAYVSLKEHHLVNRGFLHLPMLPLYGTGAVMMLWVSLPVKDNIFMVYIAGVMAATLLEYVTGYVMEQLFKIRYWDYSNQKFNLHGYICLSSSIAWGFLTIFMTEVIHRPIAQLVLRLNPIMEGFLLLVISLLFLHDTIQSTKEALKLAQTLEAITMLRSELDELQAQLSQLKTEASQSAQILKETIEEAIEARREALQARRETRREALEVRISSIAQNLECRRGLLAKHMSMSRPEILWRNPSASSTRFSSALKELRSFWDAHR